MLFVAAVVVAATAITIFELGNMIQDSIDPRMVLTHVLIVVLGTLMARIYFDIMAAVAVEVSDASDATPGNDRHAG
jgi:hypothetical protein